MGVAWLPSIGLRALHPLMRHWTESGEDFVVFSLVTGQAGVLLSFGLLLTVVVTFVLLVRRERRGSDDDLAYTR